MLPTITIFGKEIAMYGICIVIGLFLGILIALKQAKYYKLEKEDIFYSLLYAIIGMLIGAKLLYWITNIPYIIQNFSEIISNKDLLLSLISGGFVFYGGLIGAVAGIYIYTKQFKLSFKDFFLTLIPIVPFVHAIGRIGCFCAGCCYGIEYEGFGAVTFHNSLIAPNEVSLLPIQLIECVCNLFIFIILICTFNKFLNTYKTAGLYCILYSIMRFVLEFFRGDTIRGVFFGISTSQIISVFILIIGIVLFFKNNSKKSSCKVEKAL